MVIKKISRIPFKLKRIWMNRYILFLGGRIPQNFSDLRIRLLMLTFRKLYQPIPFPEFSEITPRTSRTSNVSEERWKLIRACLPDNLRDLRFLDLGAWIGYFSIQCVKEGAYAVAVEMDGRKVQLLKLVKKRYGLDTLKAIKANLADFSLLSTGPVDYVFYLNIHQHIYKKGPVGAERILAEIGQICRKGIFFESRPVNFEPSVASSNSECSKLFNSVEGILTLVKDRTGFHQVKELKYNDGNDNPYRLFYLTKN